MESSTKAPAQISLLVARLIWLGISSTNFWFWVVLRNVNAAPNAEVLSAVPEKFSFFPYIALIAFLAAWFLPKFVFQSHLKQSPQNQNETSALITPDLLQRLMPSLLVRLALLEAVALFGFVIAFQTRNLDHYVPYSIASILGFVFSFPTRRFFENISGRRFPRV